MLPKASQCKPAESPVSGDLARFYNLLAKSFPQKLWFFPAEANACTTKIKTWGDERKGVTDGHSDSCLHLMKEPSWTHPVTISAQMCYASAALMGVHLPWLCLLAGTQPVCADRNLGWEGSCQTVASKEATQQTKTTKGELSWSPVFQFCILNTTCCLSLTLKLPCQLRLSSGLVDNYWIIQDEI